MTCQVFHLAVDFRRRELPGSGTWLCAWQCLGYLCSARGFGHLDWCDQLRVKPWQFIKVIRSTDFVE